eukprot:365257-Chlamydomonas_euryale.AAC.15
MACVVHSEDLKLSKRLGLVAWVGRCRACHEVLVWMCKGPWDVGMQMGWDGVSQVGCVCEAVVVVVVALHTPSGGIAGACTQRKQS